MRVMNLPDWPPQPAEFYKGEAPSSDQVHVERVVGDVEGNISFFCRFWGESVPYQFFIWDKKSSAQFQKILNENLGQTLFDIGFLAMPHDKARI